MKKLIELEILKLWPNRSFRIYTLLYFGIILCLFTLSFIEVKLGPLSFSFGKEGAFKFPLTWHFNTYIASYFKLFLALIIVTNITNEYDFRTIKQNFIDGLSKKEFIASKVLTFVILSLISTILVGIIAFILGFRFSADHSFAKVFSEIYYLPVYFISMLGTFSFLTFAAILTRKSAFAIGFWFFWITAEDILRMLWKSKLPSVFNIFEYFPMRVTGNLIHEPFTRLSAVQNISKMVQPDNKIDYSIPWVSVILCLVWSAVFIYLSYYLIKKRDL